MSGALRWLKQQESADQRWFAGAPASEESKSCFALLLQRAIARFPFLDADRRVALTMATLLQALTNPRTLERGFFRFLASRSDSFFSAIRQDDRFLACWATIG